MGELPRERGVRVVVRLLGGADDDPAPSPATRLTANELTAAIDLRSEELGTQSFGFDGVLGPASTQLDLLHRCRQTIDRVLGGADCAIISCSFSSSSSSSTSGSLIGGEGGADPLGFLFLLARDIFSRLEQLNRNHQSAIFLQLFEVVEHAAFDLLIDASRERPLSTERKDVRTLNLAESSVTSADDIIALLKTSLFTTSKKTVSDQRRSICVLRLIIQSGSGEGQKRSALTVCDLHRVSPTRDGNLERGCSPHWDALERCLLRPNDANEEGLNSSESYVHHLIQDTLASSGQVLWVLNLSHSPENAIETRRVLEGASSARQIEQPFIPAELSYGMSLQDALREIHSLRTQLRTASITAPTRPSIANECGSCIALRERIKRLERDNEDLRAACRAHELELDLMRKEKALHSNSLHADEGGLKAKNTQDILSPYRRSSQRINACAKHDLTDCVLCQLQFPSVDYSDIARKHAPLPSISELSALRTDAIEAKVDPHGTPFPLNRVCSVHRVSNCLLCGSRNNSLTPGPPNPLEHGTVKAHIIKTSNLPSLASSTESEQRAGPRYRYSAIEDDQMSEVTISTINTVSKCHRKKKEVSKAVDRSAIDPALTPYLPSLKTKKKSRRSSNNRQQS